MNLRSNAFVVSTFAVALSLAGCKANPPAPNAEVSTPTTASSSAPYTAPADAGSIAGTVAFAGKAPLMPEIDTTMDPACSFGSTGKVLAEQFVVSNGKLANVFVYVKSGPAGAMHAGPISSQPVVLDQKGCRYTPHVIGVMQGGSVEFHNSDSTMHNIHTMPTSVGNETVDISQGPKGAPQTKQMKTPELMIPVRCNNHPWMNAFINVSATPFFAVTDASGSFNLRGLPPGDYVLGAVHEKLGEQTMNVHVGASSSAKADFSFAAR